MLGLGSIELLIVGGIAVLLFGNRLPSIARSMGSSIVEFKKGMREVQAQTEEARIGPN